MEDIPFCYVDIYGPCCKDLSRMPFDLTDTALEIRSQIAKENECDLAYVKLYYDTKKLNSIDDSTTVEKIMLVEHIYVSVDREIATEEKSTEASTTETNV